MKYETAPIHLLSHGAIAAVSVGSHKTRLKRCISRGTCAESNANGREQ